MSDAMLRRNPVLTVILAIVLFLVVGTVLSRYVPRAAVPAWVAAVIVIAVIGYIVGAILVRNGVRLPALPSLPKRRRMRVVKRDPSKAASDFIKQFEERTKR
jgi:nitrogen fixation protein